MYAVWISMHNNNETSIRNCALVILDCQYEFSADIPEEDFYNYSSTQIKKILSRYNGPEYKENGDLNEDAQKYGDDCFDFFEIFKSYN